MYSELVLAKKCFYFQDLLSNPEVGPEELNYRQEQALYWLCKAAERGSREARDSITEMLHKGQGVNEANFEAVYTCSWTGGLSVSQLMGRRVGRKTFRKLELGRGFCTSDQIFRVIQSRDVNHMNAEDVRNRCKGCQKVSCEQLVEAGSQHMDGLLPDLDATLSVYRSLLGNEISLCSMLFILSACIMCLYGLQANAILPPVLCSLSVLMLLYNHFSGFNCVKFAAWKRLWPTNLLIPGLYESALTKFVLRRNLNSSLLLVLISTVLTVFPSGFLICSILASFTILVISKDVPLIPFLSMLVPFCTTFLPLPQDYLPLLWIQALPLMYFTLKLQKPQLLWPLLLLNSYTLSFQSLTFMTLQMISCSIIAFGYKIKRFPTLLSLMPIIILLPLFWTNRTTLIQGKLQANPFKTLDWNEYKELCSENPWTMQNPMQQLGCAKWLGMPVEWTGQIAGLKIVPNEKSRLLFHSFLSIDAAMQQSLCTFYNGIQDDDGASNYCHLGGLFLGAQCYLKINMLQGSSIMGNRHFMHVWASTTDANHCLNLQIGQRVTFKGILTDYGDNTNIFIQSLV